jgi:hypothetical protein
VHDFSQYNSHAFLAFFGFPFASNFSTVFCSLILFILFYLFLFSSFLIFFSFIFSSFFFSLSGIFWTLFLVLYTIFLLAFSFLMGCSFFIVVSFLCKVDVLDYFFGFELTVESSIFDAFLLIDSILSFSWLIVFSAL